MTIFLLNIYICNIDNAIPNKNQSCHYYFQYSSTNTITNADSDC